VGGATNERNRAMAACYVCELLLVLYALVRRMIPLRLAIGLPFHKSC